MSVVEVVGNGNEAVIPTIPIRTARIIRALVAADEQNRSPARVEHEQRSDTAFRSQLLHAGVTRLVDVVHDRTSKAGTNHFEQLHPCDHVVLLLLGERRVPRPELVGVLNLPHRYQFQ